MILGATVGWGDLQSWATAWIFLGFVFALVWHVLAFGMTAVFAYLKAWVLR